MCSPDHINAKTSFEGNDTPTSNGTLQMRASDRQIIMGAAVYYGWSEMETFVKSLRRTGYTGDVLLLVANLPATTKARLTQAAVSVWQVESLFGLPWNLRCRLFSRRLRWLHRIYPICCDALPLSSDRRRSVRAWLARCFHQASLARYLYYHSYLESHVDRYDQVMLSDVRDVVFQANPFTASRAESLEFFLEHNTVTVGGEACNAQWIRDLYGDATLAKLATQRVSCSGITMGTTRAMLRYLGAMSDQIAYKTTGISGNASYDQGMHNYLARANLFPGAEFVENGHGAVLTMGCVPSSEVHIDGSGRVLGNCGQVVPVLHQYDRHPGLAVQLARYTAKGATTD